MHSILPNSFKPKIRAGRLEWENFPSSYLRSYRSRIEQREWLDRVFSVKEKALKGKNRAQRLYFDKWPQRILHWHNEHGDSRRQSLKGGQVVRATEIESQENLWTELRYKICKLCCELYQIKSPYYYSLEIVSVREKSNGLRLF